MRVRLNKQDRLAIGGLLLLPCLWYFTPLFTDASYYLGDLIGQYNPWWTFAHESLKDGRFPLWNPHVFGGMPYHVNPENSLFYPPKLPLIFFDFFRAAAILRVINTMIASVGAYLLLRSYRTRTISALLGALIFAYGSFMSYEFVHIPYVNTAVWFPWELLLLERLLRRPTIVDTLLLALVTATSFFGGSPGVFVICQLTAAFFVIAAVVRLGVRGRWRRLARALACLSSAVGLVIGLTLVLLWPAANYIRLTPRAGGLKQLGNFFDFSVIPEAVQALAFPWAQWTYGAPHPPVYPIYFLNVPYLGVGAVLLSLFVLVSRRHARLAPVAVSAVVFSVLMAMGAHSGLMPWLMQRATVFGWFRWPHDYLLMSYLVLWITAATGFDALIRARSTGLVRFIPVVAVYVLAALVWAPWSSTRFALLALAIGVGLVIASGARRRPSGQASTIRWLVGATILLVVVADLFAYSFEQRIYLPREDLRSKPMSDAVTWVRRNDPTARVAVAAATGGAHFLGKERVFTRYVPLVDHRPRRNTELTDFDRWLRRIESPRLAARLWQRRAAFHDIETTFWTYPVNASMSLDYQEISGYDPFSSDRMRRLIRALPFHRTWELFGVSYVITPQRVVLDGLEPSHRTGSLHLFRNNTALPRVVVPSRVEGSLDPDAVLERMKREDFDGASVALLEESLPDDLAPEPGPPPGAAPGTASVVEYEPDRVVLTAKMDRRGLVVLHDAYHPDWKALVDGKPADLLRVNYIFRGVPLPVGEHRVEFVYRPRGFELSAWISALCWTGCLLALGFAVLAGRRRVQRRA